MSISGLLARAGIGSWGDIAHLITRGLDIGAPAAPPVDIVLPVFAPIFNDPVSGSGNISASIMSASGTMALVFPIFAKISNAVVTGDGDMDNTTITAEGAFV